ncbi:MAG: peptidoglycan-associated lipoprotein Pal [Burkholderiaceae bacterium]
MNTTRSLSNHGKLLAVLAAAALATLAGCSTTKLDTPVPVESRTGANTGSAGTGSGANAAGASQSKVTPVDLSKDSAANGLNRVVYFDFDSFALKDEYRPTVEAYAKTLSADRKKRLAIEGHTDERGGREYNLALGQKRAEVVARSMTLLGATDTQVEAVSFGKERPAVQGSDEAAWAKNRRAELNYK